MIFFLSIPTEASYHDSKQYSQKRVSTWKKYENKAKTFNSQKKIDLQGKTMNWNKSMQNKASKDVYISTSMKQRKYLYGHHMSTTIFLSDKAWKKVV